MLRDLEEFSLTWLIDPNTEALTAASLIAPQANTALCIEDTGLDFDAVVTATPASCHAEHVLFLLNRKKHVLTEKPAALCEEDADELIQEAVKNRVGFMVGHQLLFHYVFVRLQECIKEGLIGKVLGICCNRVGPIDFNKEPGIIWAYGPHDAAMTTAILGNSFNNIHLETVRWEANRLTEAKIHLAYPDKVFADISLRASSNERIREFRVIGESGTLVFDDSIPPGKLFLFKDSETAIFQNIEVQEEPLKAECKHFASVIRSLQEPITGSSHVKTVTKILAECHRQASERGQTS